MKIAICTPVYEGTKAEFAKSLANMIAATMAAFANHSPPVVPDIETHVVRGLLPGVRNTLAAMAIDADYLLWADADMAFPRHALAALFNHHLDIVGANYLQRGGDKYIPTALGLDGKRVATTEASPAIERVSALGLGFCLIRGEAFRRMAADANGEPLFNFGTPEEGSSEVTGEDYYFFARAKKLGIPVHVDHALSRQVGHITETVLRL